MQNLLRILILVSLLQRIRNDWDYVTEQESITETPRLKDEANESLTTTVITTANTVDDEKFNDYELKRLFVKNFKLYTHPEIEEHKSEPQTTTSPRRKARAVANITGPFFGMECLSCYANGTSSLDEKCYHGVKVSTQRCSDAEYCFTEIHPLYLKRGCILPGRVNRTFVCNCPLCNDKVASQSSYFEYTSISDWAYDNIRLTKPLQDIQLPCKVCETKGSNVYLDSCCRTGKNTNYTVCGPNQICYTNINDETDFVSRGCINRIVFNPIYYICNVSLCNNARYFNPKLRLSQEEIPIRGNPSYLRSAFNFNNADFLSNRSSLSTDLTLILLLCTNLLNIYDIYKVRIFLPKDV